LQRNKLSALLEPHRHASGRGLEAKEAGGFFLFADAFAVCFAYMQLPIKVSSKIIS